MVEARRGVIARVRGTLIHLGEACAYGQVRVASRARAFVRVDPLRARASMQARRRSTFVDVSFAVVAGESSSTRTEVRVDGNRVRRSQRSQRGLRE